MTGRDHEESFLRRWSRRKIARGTEGDAVPEALPDAAPPENAADAAGLEAEAIADLPDIETLDENSDYTRFLREGVPEELKRLALRKLWLSDPVLANLDGLNDYDEDFSAVLQTGTEYMRQLADAGKKLTRPGDPGGGTGQAAESGEPAADGEKPVDVPDTEVTPDDDVADAGAARSDRRSRG